MLCRSNVVLWLVTALFTQSAIAQTDKIATGTISGRVLFGEKAAPNVTVLLRDTQSNLSEAEAIKAKAVTDADGYYKLEGIAAGRYLISPRTPTHVVPESPVSSSSDPRRSVTLAEGEAIEKMDFTLIRGGVVTGRVVDHEGKPVVGERVSLSCINEQGKQIGFWLQNYRMMELDDRGIYRIYGLPAGRYKVSVGNAGDGNSLCIGCAKNYLRRTFYPNVTNEAEAQLVEVTPGSEATNIDITLASPLKSYDVLARVVDAETGQPIAGAQCGFGLLPKDAKRLNGYGYGMVSGANGEVFFQALLPGRYGAFAQEIAGGYSDLAVFEITDGDLSGVEIKLRRGTNLSGQVLLSGAPDEAPLARLRQTRFYAYLEGTELTGPINRPITQAPDGSFTITGLPPGRLHFNLDYASRDSGFTVLGLEHQSAFYRGGIEIKAGEPMNGVRLLVLAAGRGLIRGQVQIFNGTWPAGLSFQANLIPKNVAAIPPPLLSDTPLASVVTDERGRFVFEKLAPGEYELSVFVSPKLRADIRPPKLQPIRQAVTVSEGETPVVVKIDLTAQADPRREGNR